MYINRTITMELYQVIMLNTALTVALALWTDSRIPKPPNTENKDVQTDQNNTDTHHVIVFGGISLLCRYNFRSAADRYYNMSN